jgi:hypothetical protein
MESAGVIDVRSGPWAADEVASFLDETVIPIRLASNGVNYPLVQSLWFVHDDAALWCCTRTDSVLARRLATDGRCAFEVSRDAPPYRGVRGTGDATLVPAAAPALLPRLLTRYLGDTESGLAAWLLSRLDGEVAIRISTLRVTSWDYSARM